MGITERKEREKQRRQNDIIDAAEQVFFSKGFALATMDDVAEEAELSKGTLYLYFQNKQDLYFAINSRGLNILETMFREARKKHKTGIDQVMAIGRAYVRFAREYRNYYEAMAYYDLKEVDFESSFGKCCHDIGHNTIGLLIEAIQTGIDDRTIDKSLDPVKTAIMLWGYSTGLIQLLSTQGEKLKQDYGLDIEDILTTFSPAFLKRSLVS
jgi:AcrR family transcriptional regulator